MIESRESGADTDLYVKCYLYIATMTDSTAFVYVSVIQQPYAKVEFLFITETRYHVLRPGFLVSNLPEHGSMYYSHFYGVLVCDRKKEHKEQRNQSTVLQSVMVCILWCTLSVTASLILFDSCKY